MSEKFFRKFSSDELRCGCEEKTDEAKCCVNNKFADKLGELAVQLISCCCCNLFLSVGNLL